MLPGAQHAERATPAPGLRGQSQLCPLQARCLPAPRAQAEEGRRPPSALQPCLCVTGDQSRAASAQTPGDALETPLLSFIMDSVFS